MQQELDLNNIDLSLDPPAEEPERQYYYIEKCRRYIDTLADKLGHRPTFFTQTFGCQVNTVHEIGKAA